MIETMLEINVFFSSLFRSWTCTKKGNTSKHQHKNTRTAEETNINLLKMVFVSILINVTCRFPRLYFDPFVNYREIDTRTQWISCSPIQFLLVEEK